MTEQNIAPVQQRLMDFIRQRFRPGYNHYNVSKLLGDASSRQYYRYVTDSGGSYILAAYPEQFDPDNFAYKQIYDLLQSIFIPVPEILQMDGVRGIVLQEDLGNESLQKALIHVELRQKQLLLQEAIDHIITIQHKGRDAFRPEYAGYQLAFDEPKLMWELMFFHKNYLGHYRKIGEAVDPAVVEEFRRISGELAGYPRVLCHRDFHVRNMMMNKGILYVIDFQDARWGPPAYDLCSLVKDSIALDPEAVDQLIEYYLSAVKLREWLQISPEVFERPSFMRQFHLTCIQRLLKALGTYAYQIIIRENFIYEQYMSGSLHRALLSLEELSEFPAIHQLVERELETRGSGAE